MNTLPEENKLCMEGLFQYEELLSQPSTSGLGNLSGKIIYYKIVYKIAAHSVKHYSYRYC